MLCFVVVFFKTVGIPMGTNCTSLLGDLFWYSYKTDTIQGAHRGSGKEDNTNLHFYIPLIYYIFSLNYSMIWYDVFLFNATFSNISAISWRPVLMVKEAGVIESNTGDRSKIRRRPHHNHQWNNTQCERNTKSRTLQIVIIFKIRLSYHNNNSKENVCF